jgi:hypothetical protein
MNRTLSAARPAYLTRRRVRLDYAHAPHYSSPSAVTPSLSIRATLTNSLTTCRLTEAWPGLVPEFWSPMLIP